MKYFFFIRTKFFKKALVNGPFVPLPPVVDPDPLGAKISYESGSPWS